MVGSHVHLLFVVWRKEEFRTGEYLMINKGPCSLWDTGGMLGGSELDLPRVRGVLTEREPSGPSLLRPFPETWWSTCLCSKCDPGCSHCSSCPPPVWRREMSYLAKQVSRSSQPHTEIRLHSLCAGSMEHQLRGILLGGAGWEHLFLGPGSL